MRAKEARCILLVDDHVGLLAALARMLALEGVGRCSEAAGPQEALEAAGRELPDLALVDLSPGTEEALRLVTELSTRCREVAVVTAGIVLPGKESPP